MDEFTVTIDQFSGPLDLMLHLISEKKLDLLNLDLNVLTDQYCAYIESMQEMHLEVAGEYLAEMAHLIEIKSRKMIPGSKDEETEEEDPKERMVRRLLEYQQYKEASQQLLAMYEDRSLSYSHPLSQEADQYMKENEDAPVKGSAYDLLKAMKRMLYRMRLNKPMERSVSVKEISIEDRELEVQARLDSLPETFRFERLLEDCQENLAKAIATFISVLDLARRHILSFTVDDDDAIWFTRGGVSS